MSRHIRLIALCAGLLASAGCSNERRLPTDPTPPGGSGPTAPVPPEPPSELQRLAALALFDAASVHAGMTTSPLTWATTVEGQVWTDGPCDGFDGEGALRGSIDGGLSPTSGTFLPTGSHTYVVAFSKCLVDGWSTELNGVASAAYNASDWSNVTATVSADSMRGRGLAVLSRLNDATADGSAVWTRVGSSTVTTTYTPAPGSRLVNNSTTNVATFAGGSYSEIQHPPLQGTSFSRDQRFDILKVAVNGTEYTLNGSLNIQRVVGSQLTHTGEVRITTIDGTLVARIYGDVRNALTVEVLAPLVPF